LDQHGFLVLDKPPECSSRQALDRVRRLYHTKQAGFAGTLDPLATGVLVCALGTATRLLTYLEADTKRYRATVELGRETDTDDAEGREVANGDAGAVTRRAVEEALGAFRGPIRQRPPVYSAISVGGQRLYALARRGEAVTVPERDVTIHSLTLVAWEPPRLILDVHCSKGTYIRAVARDLGRVLGCYAFLAGLRRTASGPFLLDRAVTLEQLEAADENMRLSYLLPPLAGVALLPTRRLDATEAMRISLGQRLRQTEEADGPIALLGPDGALLAIAQVTAGLVQPEKVLRRPQQL
jgi:tRNA pseudouridine55 synthase